MKLYLSNKVNLNSNSNVDNLYKNKNYDRTKKNKKETNIEKKRLTLIIVGLVFELEISTNYFFILYMADKASLFFGEKSKMQPMSSSLKNDKFLFGILDSC